MLELGAEQLQRKAQSTGGTRSGRVLSVTPQRRFKQVCACLEYGIELLDLLRPHAFLWSKNGSCTERSAQGIVDIGHGNQFDLSQAGIERADVDAAHACQGSG